MCTVQPFRDREKSGVTSRAFHLRVKRPLCPLAFIPDKKDIAEGFQLFQIRKDVGSIFPECHQNAFLGDDLRNCSVQIHPLT